MGKAIRSLFFCFPKAVVPPLKDRLRYFLANSIPRKLRGSRIVEWGLDLKCVSSDGGVKIYVRKGLLYVVPDNVKYHSGFLGYIDNINFWAQYEEPPVMVEEGDVVIDCGACIGVASLLFSQKAGKKGRVIAIEPEGKNYEVLKKVSKLNEGRGAPIFPLKVAVYKENRQLALNLSSLNPGAHTLSNYEEERRDRAKLTGVRECIEAVKIDTIVERVGLERVDFIKMDIEGAEVDALLGAEETIKRFKPKLAICTYHRPTDPVEIRKILLKYNPNYKFKELERGEKVLYAWDPEKESSLI